MPTNHAPGPRLKPAAVRFNFVDMVHGIDSTSFQTFEWSSPGLMDTL